MFLFISAYLEDFSGPTATDPMLQTGIPVNRIGREEKLRKEVMLYNKELTNIMGPGLQGNTRLRAKVSSNNTGIFKLKKTPSGKN